MLCSLMKGINNKMRLALKLFLLIIMVANFVYSKNQKYIREYTYNASERDSKQTSRQIALEQLTKLVIDEIAIYIHSELQLDNWEKRINNNYTSGEYFNNEISSITAGLCKRKILTEKWNGDEYYLKAEFTIDPNDVRRRLDDLIKAKERNRSKIEKVYEHKYYVENDYNEIPWKQISYIAFAVWIIWGLLPPV